MRQLILFAVFALISCWSFSLEIDQQGFDSSDGFRLTTRDDGLTISLQAPEGEAFIDLQFIPRRVNSPAAPLIRQIGIDSVPALENIDPNYLFWVGQRDLELRGGWNIFFDRVPTRPYSVEKGYLVPDTVTVSSHGNRATVEISGLSSTHFSGTLAFLFYQDSPFVHMEARVSTERPAICG